MAAKVFQTSLYLILGIFTIAYSLEKDSFNDSYHRIRREIIAPVELNVDEKTYTFNFVPIEREVYSRSAPVWLAKSKPGSSPNYTYERVENSEHMLDGRYHVDKDKNAVVFLHFDKNQKQVLFDGVFGENKHKHVIKSVSANRRDKTRTKRRISDHVVYRVASQTQDFSTPKKIEHYKQLFDERLETPLEILYPKLLVVVDNHLFKSLESDVAKTIKYIGTFWKAVNLKYEEIESPKVQIMITGIIIANDETALNYIYQSPFIAERKSHQLTSTLFEQTRLYFHNDFSKVMDFQNYDAAVVMTGLNIYPTAGQAHIGSICANWYNDAIVADNGDYAGVQTAIHELGHLLNLSHDESVGGECAIRGPNESISMMSPFNVPAESLFWSNCSRKTLQEFAKVKAAECLRDQHRERHYDEDLPE